jgi:hypothetical protein
MIKGSITVTWCQDDFKNLEYKTYNDPTHNLKSYIENLYSDNVNVFTCNNNLPLSLLEVSKNFQLNKMVVAVNKMVSGQVLPIHSDLYKTYRQKNMITDISVITRIIVFLEDTKIGHQLWIENNICVGKAGDYFGWQGETIHLAANLGVEDRYVLQITGTI